MVFVTAFPEEHLRTRAKAGRAVGFLARSFDGRTLADCNRFMLPRTEADHWTLERWKARGASSTVDLRVRW